MHLLVGPGAPGPADRCTSAELVQSLNLEPAPARDFRALAMQVRAAGLLDRRPGYYGFKIVLTLAAFVAGWVGFFVLGASWAILGIAAFLGVMSTQLGFLGHDAGHGQVFASRRANRLLCIFIGNGLIGLSFGWWVPKHNAHHAHPNDPYRDPDVGVGVVGIAADGGPHGHTWLARVLARRQAELFVPLMLLRSTGLYVSGAQDLLHRRDLGSLSEGLLLALRAAFYLFAVVWVLTLPEAVAFIAVYEAVFSLYLGCSFAPNHKGMPLMDGSSAVSFASQQVVTARNVSGGRWISCILGGLNYQIEHHLFPTMPRPSLGRAQDLVRTFCLDNHLGYCEEGPVRSFRQAVSSLRLHVPGPAGDAAFVPGSVGAFKRSSGSSTTDPAARTRPVPVSSP
jgi:fatty acid desaturase